MAHSELLHRVITDALEELNMGDVLADIDAAFTSYVQDREDDPERCDVMELAAEANHALPVAHELLGTLIAAQAGRL